MKVEHDYPPNILQITEVLDITGFKPVFAYGDTLYNPSGSPIPDDLMVHEETHSRQQATLGVTTWWSMYLSNPKFRFSQEVEAYGRQYEYIAKHFPRPARRFYLRQMAQQLSSKLYGNIVSKEKAEELIKNTL